jgi:hypothetical protein
MTTEQRDAQETARLAAEDRREDRWLERLAERIGGQATVRAVFGNPIERGGMTVVPVARVRWGFGGGTGRRIDAGDGSAGGSGAGGGVTADPVGYLEMGAGRVMFQRISAPYPSPAFLLASGITAALVLRALARLIRG